MTKKELNFKKKFIKNEICHLDMLINTPFGINKRTIKRNISIISKYLKQVWIKGYKTGLKIKNK